jgi:hypothetical protein
MRMWIVGILTCALLYGGFTYFKTMKFDTAVSVCVAKGRLKGLSLKLINYQVSYNDMQIKDDFWDSPLGRSIFYKLSAGLQAIVLAGKKYVDVQFEVNYLGLLRRHYRVIEVNGQFDLVAV